MPTLQCPPQEELEFKLRGDKVLFDKKIAVPGDITSKWFRDNAYCTDALAIRVCMDSPFGTDVVYVEDEDYFAGISKGFLTGGIEKGTNVWKPLAIDDQGRLCVDAAISIQNIDLEVEIDAEDGDSTGIYGYLDQDITKPTRINVTSEGYLKVITTGNKYMITIYDENTLSGSTEHVLVTHTVGAGETFSLFKASGTGRTNGIFRVRVNSSIIETKRNAWTDRNVVFNYSQGYPLAEGDVIELTVIHNELTSKPFTGTLYGESV